MINPNFDWHRLKTLVFEAITDDREIRYQPYDFKTGALSPEFRSVPSEVAVIVEGVWSLQEAFADFYDYKIWLEVPSDARLERGVARDGEELRQVWVDEWIPIDEYYNEFYKPQLQADLIVDGLQSDYMKNEIVIL